MRLASDSIAAPTRSALTAAHPAGDERDRHRACRCPWAAFCAFTGSVTSGCAAPSVESAPVRAVWVSFDTIGRDCLLAARESGAEIVGVVTLPGPVDPTRSGQCSFDDVGAPVVETADVNAPETIEAVRALRPDVIFVLGWSQLVRADFIALAPGAVYGMHPTLLPRHRGRAPIPWTILSGLARTGVTLFEIVDPTADSGPLVGQVEVEVAADETATTLFEKLRTAHLELVHRFVPLLLAGEAPREPQDARR